jgi:ribose transport system permease protein
MGAIFMYSMGGFDLSFGAACAMSAMCGVIVYNSTSSVFLMFLVAIAVAVLIGLINSALAGVLKLPVFITSIASTTVISAMLVNFLRLQQGGRITVNSTLFADAYWYKALALLLFFALIEFVFNFTPLGRQSKALGTNPANAELSGISNLKVTILAYVISGVGVGLAAALWIPANSTVSSATASSLGIDVMIALVFGAMPLSGGPRSRVSSALLGSFTSVLISQIMVVLNLSYYSGLVKGLIFIFFVFIANLGTKKAGLLPK